VSRDIPDTLENGVHLFTIPTQAKFEQQLSITFSVAFREFPEIEGQPVITVINQLEQLQDNPNRCGFCTAGDSSAV